MIALGARWRVAVGLCAWGCLFVAGVAPRTVRAQALPDGWYEEGDGTSAAEEGTAPSSRGVAAPRALLPGRLVLQAGAGLSVRTSVDTNFRQERLAPAFVDLAAMWITRSDRAKLRFGPALEVSTNLTHDGPALNGILPLRQWVLAPGFTVRFVPGGATVPRVVVELRPSVPWVVGPRRTWGLAATLGIAVMVRAALGVYMEATASIVAGGGTRDAVFTRPAMISLDAGVRVDLERLP